MKLDAGYAPKFLKREEAPPDYQPPTAAPPPSPPRYDSIPPATRLPAPIQEPPTHESAIPAPPSFTTSTSFPKPAMPIRSSGAEKTPSGSNDVLPVASNDRPSSMNTTVADVSRSEITEQRNTPKTYVLSQRGRTEGLRSDQSELNLENNADIFAKLVIERGGRVGKEFAISGIETSIGRWDADSGIFPDVDLDEDDPEAKVSRRHARIIKHNGQFLIEDLGSTNGTFVNRGRRLLPGKRQMLQHGDEVIVGKTFLKFQVIKQ
ncbi:MAG: FHA domain-containing protein [Acidobacteriota bacterium]